MEGTRRRARPARGFTLPELLVVVAIGFARLLPIFLLLPPGIALAADAVAAWRTWLEPAPPPAAAAPPVFPNERELASLRANRAWIARWTMQPPSVAWNEVVAGLVVKYQQNPLRAARAYTYVHTAVHDALVLCARRNCEAAVWPIAMHVAAGRMLDHLYTGESSSRMEALGHSAATAALAAGGTYPQAELAWRIGCAVADNAIRRALGDGWDLPRLPVSRPAWKPGVWRASPPLNMYDPADPYAGRWRPWVLKDGAEVDAPPPPAYDSPAYRAELEEVYAVQQALTPAQKRSVEEWNLGQGSITPVGVWNMRAAELVLQHKLAAEQAARVFATVSAAMMDSLIACWSVKFNWWTERPITVIRDRIDPAFMPYAVTPAFPAYVSGHSTVSGAATAVLSGFFAAERDKLRAMAQEASVSRLYAGIHFRSDNDAGLELGRRIGARALARLDETAAAAAATAQSAAIVR